MTRLGLKPQPNENPAERCAAGAVRLPGLQLRPALLPADRPVFHRSESVEEERAASKGEGGREVCGGLNRLLRGWCGYFSPGTHYVTDRAIEAHLYDRVRNFLVRRHKLPSRGTRQFSENAVFGPMGLPRLRNCRIAGAMSCAWCEASRRAGCGKSARPVVCPGKASMFSRRHSCRGKSQNPVVWIAEAA
jgi:hypothetical protein